MKTTLTLLLLLFSATICGSFAFHGLLRKVSRRSVTVNGLSDFHLGFIEIILSVAAFVFTLPTIQKKFSTDTSPYFLNNLENFSLFHAMHQNVFHFSILKFIPSKFIPSLH